MQFKGQNLTISNCITVSRLILLPFIVYFLVVDHRLTAFIIMLIALISDSFDGFIARKLKQESELGKFLDPLCDKISLAVILLTLIVVERMPLWSGIIIVRDFLILLGSYFLLRHRSLVFASNLWGKITGFIFGAIILAFTLKLRTLGMFFLYLSIPAVIGTFIIYTHRYIKIMKGV